MVGRQICCYGVGGAEVRDLGGRRRIWASSLVVEWGKEVPGGEEGMGAGDFSEVVVEELDVADGGVRC